MTKFTALAVSSFLLAILITLGCSSGMSNTRMLQSITVTPATAVAPNPGGQVQFAATGKYSRPPSPSKIMNGFWCVGDNNGCVGSTSISVDANGLAQCDPAFSGTMTVRAFASGGGGAGVMSPSDAAVLISGTAELTCP